MPCVHFPEEPELSAKQDRPLSENQRFSRTSIAICNCESMLLKGAPLHPAHRLRNSIAVPENEKGRRSALSLQPL